MNNLKLLKYLTWFTRIFLLVFNSFWFVFALLSGAEKYGGGFRGIIKNSPNALPWLLLFGIVYLAWKNEFLGGVIIFTLGILTMFAFNTYRSVISFLIISFPLVSSGVIMFVNYFLKKKALRD